MENANQATVGKKLNEEALSAADKKLLAEVRSIRATAEKMAAPMLLRMEKVKNSKNGFTRKGLSFSFKF